MAEQLRTTPVSKPSIVHHPLFPATVALWFGALFGLGSLAVRPALLEAAVIAVRLDALLPAAAPPLGSTARILLSLAMAAIGGTIGAVLARRLARPRPLVRERKRQARSADAQEAPASAQFIMQATAEPRAPGAAQRRRQLAMDEDSSRSDYEERAPLPGVSPNILDVKAFELDGFEERAESEDEAQFVAPSEAQDAGEDTGEPAEAHCWTEAGDDGEDGAEHGREFPDNSLFEAYSQDLGTHRGEEPQPAPGAEAARDGAAPFAAPFEAPGAPFAAPDEVDDHFWQATRATAPQAEIDDEESASARPAPIPQNEEREAQAAAAFAGIASDARSAAERIASADLGELSHVELVERLALCLERRRRSAEVPAEREKEKDTGEVSEARPEISTSWSFGPASSEMAPAATPQVDCAGPAEADAPALGRFPSIPTALRPIGIDEVEEEDESIPAFVPPRQIGAPRADAAPQPSPHALQQDWAKEEDELDEESRSLEEGYSSLLSLSRPASPRQEFIRIEEPDQDEDTFEPVVIFPGQEPGGNAPFARQESPEPGPATTHRGHDCAGEPNEQRTFDGPQVGAPSGQSGMAKRQDQEETEKSLRAALATLQRMSGGA